MKFFQARMEWMSSYLSGRYKTVTIDGKLSEPVKMTFSVPQGSVLGPKFYTIYTTPVGAICNGYGLVQLSYGLHNNTASFLIDHIDMYHHL